MLLANTAQIREADRIQIEEFSTPGILLMEQAGRETARGILELFSDQQSFLILSGPGNNGGDGLVIARHLHLAGREVLVLLSADPEKYSGDAELAWKMLSALPVPTQRYPERPFSEFLEMLTGEVVLVDALLGTGISSALRSPIDALVNEARESGRPCVAVDLPSGLDADTGAQINPVIDAEYTFTFHLPKVCHAVTPAALACGEVFVVDIGIWPQVNPRLQISREILDQEWLLDQYRPRQTEAHKGNYGHVLMVGGSKNMAGAIALAADAALKSGAGLASVFTPGSCREAVYAQTREVMCRAAGDTETEILTSEHQDQLVSFLEGKNVVALGPGLGQDKETACLVEGLLDACEVPMVLDADALNLLSQHPHWWEKIPKGSVITPHPGEMMRLLKAEKVNENRLEIAEQMAQDRMVVVVLKGAGTIVAAPDGRTYVNSSGNPGMASGGVGDVLTGMIAGWMAQGYSAITAAGLAVYLHGAAADLLAREAGGEAVTAQGLISNLGEALMVEISG